MAKKIETLRHEDRRVKIPIADVEPLVPQADRAPVRVAYARRNRDLDPLLVWRGTEEQDLGDLVVNALPRYLQEKMQTEALIHDLLRRTAERRAEQAPGPTDLFANSSSIAASPRENCGQERRAFGG